MVKKKCKMLWTRETKKKKTLNKPQRQKSVFFINFHVKIISVTNLNKNCYSSLSWSGEVYREELREDF